MAVVSPCLSERVTSVLVFNLGVLLLSVTSNIVLKLLLNHFLI